MSIALAIALAAQMQGMDHAGHMPGMTMPMAKPAAPARTKSKPRKAPRPPRTVSCSAEHAAMGHCAAPTLPPAPTSATSCPPEHEAMGHCSPEIPPAPAAMPDDVAPASACPPEHQAMGHCPPARSPETASAPPSGTALAPGNAPAPAAPAPHYADRIWGAAAMAPARALLRREHGGATFSQVMLNIAEWQPHAGADGYRWDGEAWFGGDIDRLVIKSEGEGRVGRRVDGEVQALYSRAIGPYFNVQGGIRQDLGNDRRYAVAGIEGVAPYWFDVEATAFLSDRGDLLARVEGYYDQRITQRLILQPRAELNLSAQDIPRDRTGAGLVDAELGIRLRYEIRREFAPYVGVSWERAFGDTRRWRSSEGGPALAIGVRGWF